jgi:hypothetical protein
MEDRGWRTSFNHSILYPLIPYPLFSILYSPSSIFYPRSSILHPRSSILDPPFSKAALPPRLARLPRSADSHSHARAEVQPVSREPEYLLIVLVEQVVDSRE